MSDASVAAEPTQVVILTGMSGAGRSTAAHAMEDLGWYVVDNLPPQMLVALVELTSSRTEQRAPVARVAAVVDARSGDFFTAFRQLVISGYYTSEVGITQERHYLPVPGDYDGAYPYAKVKRIFSS